MKVNDIYFPFDPFNTHVCLGNESEILCDKAAYSDIKSARLFRDAKISKLTVELNLPHLFLVTCILSVLSQHL